MGIQQVECRRPIAQKRDDLPAYIQARVVVDVLIRSIEAVTHENDIGCDRAFGVHHCRQDKEIGPGREFHATPVTVDAESAPRGVLNALTQRNGLEIRTGVTTRFETVRPEVCRYVVLADP
jgi:hypothetical protein